MASVAFQGAVACRSRRRQFADGRSTLPKEGVCLPDRRSSERFDDEETRWRQSRSPHAVLSGAGRRARLLDACHGRGGCRCADAGTRRRGRIVRQHLAGSGGRLVGRGHCRDGCSGSRRAGPDGGRNPRHQFRALGGGRRLPATRRPTADYGAAGGGGQRRGAALGAPGRRARRGLRSAGPDCRRADGGRRPGKRLDRSGECRRGEAACHACTGGVHRGHHPAAPERRGRWSIADR